MTRNFEKRELKTITFNVGDKGLGIYIIGGAHESEHGIFIKSVLPGGLASLDGRLQEGDQIASVNGEDFTSISNEKAVELLKRASEEGFVQLKICRDLESRENYKKVCEMYTFSRQASPGMKNGDSREGSIERKDFLDGKNAQIPTDDRSRPIDPGSRMNLERLQESLEFLGVHLSKQEEMELRSRLDVDSDNTVPYGEFVQIAKSIFVNRNKLNLAQFISDQTKSLDRFQMDSSSPYPNKHQNFTQLIQNKDKTILALERELLRHRNELHVIKEELKNVSTRLKLAEDAQKVAKKTEEDYELVLRHLEKNNFKKEVPGLKDELDVLQYQIKKCETESHLSKTANEKLMNFAKFVSGSLKRRKEHLLVHDAMRKSTQSLSDLDFTSSDDVILSQANQTIASVQSLFGLDSSTRAKEIFDSKSRTFARNGF